MLRTGQGSRGNSLHNARGNMQPQTLVTRAEWIKARKELLAAEKEFTRQRDVLSTTRRQLPWVIVEKDYIFTTSDGEKTLSDLFEDKGQLVVYHFMYGPAWEEGCPSCSFWADNFNGVDIHLANRDTALVAMSNAPIDKLRDYQKRMGWDFVWVSAMGTDFNRDYHVSFTQEELDSGKVEYNFKEGGFPSTEAPGLSVFVKMDDGRVAHSYSTYARGLDMINGAYHILDLTPKGRDEADLPYTQAWVKRRDQYKSD